RLDDQIEFEDALGGGTFIAQDDEVFSQTTTLGFLLWDGGGRGASWRASRASEEMVRAQAARELQLLDREVAQSYLSWAEALQESAVLAASVEALEGALERARSLEALGRATRSDVLVVEVELERTRYDMRRLRDIAADARDELTRLLSLPAEATLVEPAPRETESLLDAGRSIEIFDIGATALERRAELLAIAEERRAAVFALEAENARYWPR